MSRMNSGTATRSVGHVRVGVGVGRVYDALNGQLFSSRLPPFTVRWMQPQTTGQLGRCEADKRLILLVGPRPIDAELRQVLLHEMCHIGCPGHGKRFQRKLRHLANLGEAWAEEEARQYAEAVALGRRLPLTAQLRHAIDDLAIAHPELAWRVARRVLCRDGCSDLAGTGLKKMAPWAAAAWRKAAAEVLAARARRQRLVAGIGMADVERPAQ
jgi:hypothetical protein